MDDIDRRILRELQQDANLSTAQIADRVGLSQTPCWNRIQKLAASGAIMRRVAIVSPESVGLGLTVLVSIEAGEHNPDWLTRFTGAVSAMPEVLELYRMAGDVDYELRVVVPDMAAYDEFYKRLIAIVPLRNVTSRFAMERIKSETALPITLERDRMRRERNRNEIAPRDGPPVENPLSRTIPLGNTLYAATRRAAEYKEIGK